MRDVLTDTRLGANKNESITDVAALLVVMDRKWNDVFRKILGKSERSLVIEIIAVRNRWAHQETFSGEDADRALDSAERLLTAMSAAQADEIRKIKMELRRTMFDEQARSEKRKIATTAIESAAASNLKSWREVVTPHRDVASGRYKQAEFAAPPSRKGKVELWYARAGAQAGAPLPIAKRAEIHGLDIDKRPCKAHRKKNWNWVKGVNKNCPTRDVWFSTRHSKPRGFLPKLDLPPRAARAQSGSPFRQRPLKRTSVG